MTIIKQFHEIKEVGYDKDKYHKPFYFGPHRRGRIIDLHKLKKRCNEKAKKMYNERRNIYLNELKGKYDETDLINEYLHNMFYTKEQLIKDHKCKLEQKQLDKIQYENMILEEFEEYNEDSDINDDDSLIDSDSLEQFSDDDESSYYSDYDYY